MDNSDTFKTVSNNIEYSSTYSMPEEFTVTGSAVLYRVRKAGKYFIIKTPKDNSGQSLALLQREYDLSIGKQHPHIVSIFTYEPSTIVGPGIVMEYIDGRTLTQFIAENPTFTERKRVFKQLLDAVSYIHRSGLVHNDIKPDNIMVTRSGNDVKLIDFGLADNDAYYLARTLGCTKAYASPELQAQEKDIDARSDIYSLGVIMKELFGNRYSGIAARCVKERKEKRYNNVGEIAKAIDRRDKLPKIITLLLAASLIIIPLAYYTFSLKSVQERVETDKKVKKEQTDENLNRITYSIDSIGNIYYSLVSKEKYYEFAYPHLEPYYNAMIEYKTGVLSEIKDTELYSLASAQYSKKYSNCLKKIVEKIESLPSINDSGLSEEEVEFYRTLILSKQPFTPYSGK